MVEVLVVGGGPAGSTAALRLARAGREVLLVERRRFPRLKPCGEFYNPACCRLLDELGVLPALQAAGARALPSVVMGCPLGGRLSVPFIGGRAESALSVGREVLDPLLLEAARAAGVRVWEGAEARGPLIEDQNVRGAVVEREGSRREVRARVTLAADGLRSRFARRLGLGAGDGGRRRFGLTARFQAAAGAGADRVEMHAAGDSCCGLSLRGDEANVGMVVGEGAVRAMGGNPAGLLGRALRDFPEVATGLAGDPRSLLTVGPLTWRTRRQSAAGCLLLGDAAGFYDPFTGEGVTFALLTARLAAGVVDAALAAGDLSADRLAEYDRLRRAALGPRLLLQRSLQGLIARPAVWRLVTRRLAACPAAAVAAIGAIADSVPPHRLLSPIVLRALLG